MKRHILIVEDCETTRKHLQKLLAADPDLEVDTAATGTKALEALVNHHYSLALIDLRMPGLDGRQLVEEVEKGGLPVTVIVTTGSGSIDDAVRAMRLGAYDFLTKPLDMDHLLLVLKRALRERTLQDEVSVLQERLQD